MAGNKNIYNSTSLECALEVLWRTVAVRLDPDFVTYDLTSISNTQVRLRMTARATAADGRLPIYSGTTDFLINKANLEAIIPRDIVYGGEYPTTFERLRNYLRTSYDFLLEEGEFTVVGSGNTPLTGVTPINVPRDGQGRIYLQALPASRRWIAGGQFQITLTGAP